MIQFIFYIIKGRLPTFVPMMIKLSSILKSRVYLSQIYNIKVHNRNLKLFWLSDCYLTPPSHYLNPKSVCHQMDPRSTFDSLAPGRFERNLRKVIFKLILMIYGWGIFCKIALRWMSMDLTDDKSTLVQVMAWCRQATSHYLSQYWPRSLSSYGVTRPQWVKWNLNQIQNDFLS